MSAPTPKALLHTYHISCDTPPTASLQDGQGIQSPPPPLLLTALYDVSTATLAMPLCMGPTSKAELLVQTSQNLATLSSTPQPPFTATQLQEHASYINRRSNMIPGFDPPPPCSPILKLDVPWHGIVVHDLPAASLLVAFEGDQGKDEEALGLWKALEKEAGIPQEHIRDVQMLCRDEDQGN
jgi:hypothetical protein